MTTTVAPAHASASASTNASSAEHPAVYVFGKTADVNLHYHLGRQLGQPGQFGRAVLATHHETGQLFACKIITKAKFLKSESSLAQFKQEIEIMKQLSHPHIIHFESVYEDRNNIYIIMELCSGGEMFDRIQTYGAYSEIDASRLLRQITRALRHMHAHNIAHCDLKPDNFLLTTKDPDAPVKVIDFGLSKFVKHRQYFNRFCGTPYYIAPDVLRGRYNESADMWSLGVVMFVMLFGYPPFYADPNKYGKMADQRIYELIKQGFDPTVKKGYGPWFPQALPISASARDLISKLLTSDSAKRLTAEEALSHDWLKGDTASAIPLDPLVVKALKTFEYHCKFKNAVLELMIDQLSDDDIAKLRKSFKSMDEDGSGTITIDELKKALVQIKKEAREARLAAEVAAAQLAGLRITPPTAEQLRAGHLDDHKEANEIAESIMRTVDVNGDGVISYQELMLSYVHRKLNSKEERLYAAFCRLDRDGNGRLTIDELEHILQENGMLSTRAELEAMIKEVDVDGNGMIDYEEFLNMMWIQTNKEVEELQDDLPERAKEEVQEIRRRSASNSPATTPRSHLTVNTAATPTSTSTSTASAAAQHAVTHLQPNQPQPSNNAMSPFITHKDIAERDAKQQQQQQQQQIHPASPSLVLPAPVHTTHASAIYAGNSPGPVTVPGLTTTTAPATTSSATATTTSTSAAASSNKLQAPVDKSKRKNSEQRHPSHKCLIS